VSEAQRLRQLEEENRRLKHLVADLSLEAAQKLCSFDYNFIAKAMLLIGDYAL
jgi:hypothetical protein